jgi:ATP-dependent DNA ligase
MSSFLGAFRGCCIFDGEIVVLNELGRPQFNALMFSRRAPVYVAFDVLYFNGQALEAIPLSSRKSVLKQLLRARHDLIGRLFNAVCELDLVGCR